MQSLAHIALLVRDYDEALTFYVGTLGFRLVEDTLQPAQNKRWVMVAPPGPSQASLLLARATTPEQVACIGNQTGGRVFLFLRTDDFWRDYQRYVETGVQFVGQPREDAYGTVAVFKDLYGNLWDLLQYNDSARDASPPVISEAVAVVRTFWALMASNDFDSVAAVLSDDYVLDWPQSNERIRGARNFVRMNAEYPAHGPWTFTIHRLFGEGEQVVSEVGVSDGVQSARAISFFTVRDCRIVRQIEYWPDSYPAPANRTHLVEPIT